MYNRIFENLFIAGGISFLFVQFFFNEQFFYFLKFPILLLRLRKKQIIIFRAKDWNHAPLSLHGFHLKGRVEKRRRRRERGSLITITGWRWCLHKKRCTNTRVSSLQQLHILSILSLTRGNIGAAYMSSATGYPSIPPLPPCSYS